MYPIVVSPAATSFYVTVVNSSTKRVEPIMRAVAKEIKIIIVLVLVLIEESVGPLVKC